MAVQLCKSREQNQGQPFSKGLTYSLIVFQTNIIVYLYSSLLLSFIIIIVIKLGKLVNKNDCTNVSLTYGFEDHLKFSPRLSQVLVVEIVVGPSSFWRHGSGLEDQPE